MKSTMFKRLALAAALGTFALATPAAFARDQSKGHGKHEVKAAKDYRKAVNKAQKEEQKAYRRWAKGQSIPREYVVERYYVRDYRTYDLSEPPSGYVWVRPYPEDNTYYMVQMASGLISQIFGR